MVSCPSTADTSESGQPLNVETTVRYNSDTESFIIGYGHRTGRMSSIGIGGTISSALSELADSISSSFTHDEIQTTLRSGVTCNFTLKLHYLESENDYLAILSDGETQITGQGHSSSAAFNALAEKTTA